MYNRSMIKEVKELCKENGVADILGNIILAGDAAKFKGEPSISVQMPDKKTLDKFKSLLSLIGYDTIAEGNLIHIKI